MSDPATPTSYQSKVAVLKQKVKDSGWLLMVLLLVATVTLFAAAGGPAQSAVDYLRHGDNASALAMHSCAWKTLKTHRDILDVPRIARGEFLARQKALAQELQRHKIDVLVTEPSATSAYYFNVSASYELSERPFLIMLDAKGQASYLLPKFEEHRLRGLNVVAENLRIIAWDEQESPYDILKKTTDYDKIMVDESLRHMIAAGLQEGGMIVLPLTKAVKQLRAIKSAAEITILKAVNTYTHELLRSLQSCMVVGTTQNDVMQAIKALYTRVGLQADHWAIVLFGAQAADPHGGSYEGRLGENEFILIDTGTSLHGYSSDVTRTMVPKHENVTEDLLHLWHVVYDAQSAAIDKLKPNITCSDVDAAARSVIDKANYGKYFTHRLGHGLGLEMHEHPYLNGANSDRLLGGEVATCEPGIYVSYTDAREIDDEENLAFGIRIEDPILVDINGPILLTNGRASSPWSP